jgi:hypothetical protein
MDIEALLPKTDAEADERLIKVISNYIIEKEMPLSFAKNVLENNLRNKAEFSKFWFQLLIITGTNV